MATLWPSLASASATPRPRPRLAPVTRTAAGAFSGDIGADSNTLDARRHPRHTPRHAPADPTDLRRGRGVIRDRARRPRADPSGRVHDGSGALLGRGGGRPR